MTQTQKVIRAKVGVLELAKHKDKFEAKRINTGQHFKVKMNYKFLDAFDSVLKTFPTPVSCLLLVVWSIWLVRPNLFWAGMQPA